ncbi:urease accessory protein UreD [Pseudomonas typographi]|uniref:urease accessory protein UreD n=1 Tax=Pseudomonas typographi TaxID=2715964 RepID=UPI0016829750|nr:urease accessory protein UreD [Pseudomonas typographi]MBD1590102.1 urease accessory protein [Pseudomonas typographi]
MSQVVASATPQAPIFAWQASLDLAYGRFGEHTRPVLRRHLGPLRVQKHLYAEGPEVCQHIVVHPPAGIAGGDRLAISATAQAGAWAQLTSPGAAKWYRAASPASQTLALRAEPGATLEWLPQETIVYSGAQAQLATTIDLQGDARLCYWDVVALGRPASAEAFERGYFQARLDVRRNGELIWHERQRILGNDGLLGSPVGLCGYPVFGTLLITGTAEPGWLAQCRALPCRGRGDVTQLPGLVVARCLAREALQARDWLISVWRVLRPALLGREALPPRIWNT